eukprot:SAG11_NODE_412_length_9695_cov_5.948729_1_plen_287_part_00
MAILKVTEIITLFGVVSPVNFRHTIFKKRYRNRTGTYPGDPVLNLAPKNTITTEAPQRTSPAQPRSPPRVWLRPNWRPQTASAGGSLLRLARCAVAVGVNANASTGGSRSLVTSTSSSRQPDRVPSTDFRNPNSNYISELHEYISTAAKLTSTAGTHRRSTGTPRPGRCPIFASLQVPGWISCRDSIMRIDARPRRRRQRPPPLPVARVARCCAQRRACCSESTRRRALARRMTACMSRLLGVGRATTARPRRCETAVRRVPTLRLEGTCLNGEGKPSPPLEAQRR